MTELPAGWCTAPLRDLVQNVESADLRAGDAAKQTWQYIDVGSLDNGANRVRRIDNDVIGVDAPTRARQLLRRGDVLVSTVRPNLRKVAIVDADVLNAVGSTAFCVLRADAAVLPEWLYYACQLPAFTANVVAKARGVSYPAVRDNDILDQVVVVPPLPEQQRIVEAIEEAFSKLDAGERSVAAAARRLARLRDAWFDTCTLRPEVEYVALETVATVSGGIQKQPSRKPDKNPYPFLRVANVGRGSLDLAEMHQVELRDGELARYALQRGDLLVVEGNGSPDQIGRSAMWHGAVENCVHQNHLIKVRPGDAILPEFLELAWNSPHIRSRVQALASSTTGLHTLSTGKLKQLTIPVPDLGVQRELVEKAQQGSSLVAALDAQLRQVVLRQKSLRSAVLRAAFTGHLVEQDPADETAIELLERIQQTRATTAPAARPSRMKKVKVGAK